MLFTELCFLMTSMKKKLKYGRKMEDFVEKTRKASILRTEGRELCFVCVSFFSYVKKLRKPTEDFEE